MCRLFLFLLVLQAIWRPGDGVQAGRLNRQAAGDAFAIGTIFDVAQPRSRKRMIEECEEIHRNARTGESLGLDRCNPDRKMKTQVIGQTE